MPPIRLKRRLAILALTALCAGCAPAMKAQMEMVDTLRVKDAVTAYEAARTTTPLDRCVKAKLVAIAYADAKDSANASAWRAREREDCQAAIAALGVEVRYTSAAGPRRADTIAKPDPSATSAAP